MRRMISGEGSVMRMYLSDDGRIEVLFVFVADTEIVHI